MSLEDYPRPSVTVDVIVCARRDDEWQVLLIRRKHPPCAGMWAIPGGFLNMDESLETAARRELEEETGVRAEHLEQLYTFGDPGRDPRGRVITVAYLARVPPDSVHPRAGDDAAEARWWPLDALPPLAFDHADILARARRRLDEKRGLASGTPGDRTGEQQLLSAAAPLIELALAEDIGPGDATSEAVLPPDLRLDARIIAKAPGVIAGLPIAQAVFTRVDSGLCFVAHVSDGDRVSPGDLVAEVSGPARGMLAAERTALNFLQRLSGIATLTRAFVDAVAGTRATILDTRKTHPGYRALEKYAVRMGGAQNHRAGLYDMLLVKDNHIAAAGSLTAAVERARAAHPDLPLEVEVKDLDELREALALPVERIMLDNFDLEGMRAAVALTAGRVPLEASGGVSLARVAAIAATGVDFISVGALTHSAPALDVSLEVGSWKLEVGSWKLEAGSWKLEAGSWKLEAGSWKLEVGSWKPEAGDWKQPEGIVINLQPPTSNLQPPTSIPHLKATLGPQVVILGHHYQRDEVIAHADFRGDSLQLARDAARCRDARFIVFCGVHFMAETAAILAQPGQTVLLPELEAGCYLADMADLPLVERAWAQLGAVLDVEREVMPVTYVNSTAELKAFCGRHGGVVCTSSNAAEVLAWALARRPRVLFFPDQHLGRNTAKRMGIPLEEMVLWDPRRPDGGHDTATLRRARVFLWRGWCFVHQCFRPEHIAAWRARRPDIRVIVHPECPMEVVDLADEAGSTSFIIRRVEESPPGSAWAIGTEFNLVNRLQNEHPEQFIASLSPQPNLCRTMNMITAEKLARVLEGLQRGELVNPITVPPDVAAPARLALERMLEVKP